MKQCFKKFISIFTIVAIMIPYLGVNAYNLQNSSASEYGILLEHYIVEGETFELYAKEFSNGDVDITQLKNGELISSSYLNRNDQSVTYKKYSNGFVVDTHKKHYYISDISQQNATRASFPVGSITYSADRGTNTISLSYTSKVIPSEYDVNGTYRDKTELLAFLIGVLSIPAGVAQVALGIIMAIGGYAIQFTGALVFREIKVRAEKTTVTWDAINKGTQNLSTSFSGSKYVVTEVGYDSHEDADFTYWDPSCFSKRDVEFAKTVYAKFWGNEPVTITKWTNAY